MILQLTVIVINHLHGPICCCLMQVVFMLHQTELLPFGNALWLDWSWALPITYGPTEPISQGHHPCFLTLALGKSWCLFLPFVSAYGFAQDSPPLS